MVCGVLRPVLALPAEEGLDDHVLLHELLHIKYFDALQNAFWSLCRALHWCNPVIQWMLNRVGNDQEALCDQRVLERLEGEERRRYGIALLAMANDRYPQSAGDHLYLQQGQEHQPPHWKPSWAFSGIPREWFWLRSASRCSCSAPL